MPRRSSHLDPILSSGRNDFAAVKLQRRHGVLILDRLKDAASAQVPDLYKKKKKRGGQNTACESERGPRAECQDTKGKGELGTYPHGFIQTPTDDVDFVKLKARNRARMTQERPVCLASTHVPHSDCAVPTPTHECILPRLHGSNKVLVQFPASVCIRRGWHGERAHGRRGANGRETRHVPRGQRRWMGNRPEDVHRHHTLPSREVPLA